MPELAVNSLSPDTVHNAEEPQVTSDNSQHIRALASPFTRTQLITQDDGSLLIKGVPMLAAGQWTDSAVQTPLFYPEKTLSEYATNWSDTTGWSRHLGGNPRDITEKVANAENLRYENGAITADIVVHGATQKSRDTIELVKRKLISFVSVEHTGQEVWNKTTRQMEASTLNFHGFAFVNRGACKLCRINEVATVTAPTSTYYTATGTTGWGMTTPPIAEEPVKQLEEDMTKELEEKIASLEKQLAEKTVQAEVKPDPWKELAEKQEEKIKELSEAVKKLSEQPAATVTAPTSQEPRALGTVETIAIVDRKAGTIRGV